MHLAQTDPGAASTFTNIFWLTIGFIFLTAIISTVVARRRRDRVLRLLHDFRVTMALANGTTVWGDLWIYPQGMEVRYDAVYRTGSGAIKSSYMLYDTEINQLHALCRWAGDQSEGERQERAQQVKRRANPGAVRRFWRGVKNWFNTIRDAFTQALGAFLGQIGKVRPGGVIQTQQGQVEKIGQTLIQSPGFAYEPMLEKHIGQPVVLEVSIPNDPRKLTIDLPGYLAEYSKDYVAIFNVDHRPTQTIELPMDEPAERHGLKLDVESHQVVVTNMEPVPLVIAAMSGEPGQGRNLGVVLLQGCSARLSKFPGAARLRLLRVERLDVLCPRNQARVRHGSLESMPTAASENLPPTGDDRIVVFPKLTLGEVGRRRPAPHARAEPPR